MRQKYYKYVNTLFVVTPMTFVMSLISLLYNYGFQTGWLFIFLKAWGLMLPTAYVIAFIILPFARKLTDKIIK